jgi:hypothetical protein
MKEPWDISREKPLALHTDVKMAQATKSSEQKTYKRVSFRIRDS